MKKNVLLSLTLCCLCSGEVFAQSAPPAYFQYQAVARDASGVIANNNIGIEVSILGGGSNGTEVYKEEHGVVPTNEFGLFTLKIGNGNVKTGTNLSAIDWGAGTYWMRIGFKPPGQNNFHILNATQLLSVPYALYAEKAGSASQWLNNPTGIHYSGGRVGIRAAAPQGQLEIVNDQELTTGLVVTKTIGNEPIALFRASSGNSGSSTSIGRDGILNINRFFSPAGNSTFLRFYRENVPKARIGLNAQDELAFMYGDTETPAMIIDAANRVGIGTDEPAAKLGIRAANSDTEENLIDCRKDGSSGTRNFIVKMRPAVPEVLLTTDGTGGTPRLTLGPANGQSAFITMLTNENSGVNTSNPEAGLDILRSNGAPALRVTKSAGQEHIAVFRRDPAPGVEPAMVITRQGFVGIGTDAPSQELHVIGSICYTGSSTSCSDGRYKQDIQPIAGALEKLSRINGRYYHWKQADFPEKKFSAQRQIGVVAQEVEQHFPELVYTDPEGYKSVDYARLTPVLIEAVKEQQAQIEELRAKVEQMEQLECRLAKIELLLKKENSMQAAKAD